MIPSEYRRPRPPIFILWNTGGLEANSTFSLCRKVCGRVCKWIVSGQPPTSPSSKKRKVRNKENPETKKKEKERKDSNINKGLQITKKKKERRRRKKGAVHHRNTLALLSGDAISLSPAVKYSCCIACLAEMRPAGS